MTDEAKVKKVREYSKHTATWQLFDYYFLQLPSTSYPVRLGPYTKGQALNLSIGMNTCHVQHQRETGLPSEAMLYSAKPKKEGEDWFIEISTNYTRTGQTKPSRRGKFGQEWMNDLLTQVQGDQAKAPTLRDLIQEQEDPQEALLAKYMKGE